jgi:gas vesicle protein
MTGATDEADMLIPVTRGELRAELKQLRLEIQQAIAPLATKVELELWGGALLERMGQQLREGMQQMQQQMQQWRQEMQQQMQQWRQEMQQQMQQWQQQMHSDLARHTGAIHESTQAMIRVLDDKYAGLPGRVSVLEAAVFDQRPRGAPRSRRR